MNWEFTNLEFSDWEDTPEDDREEICIREAILEDDLISDRNADRSMKVMFYAM
ncbi:MAG: hypothetical protein AB8B99_04710 [Phormidesmis sp.]